MNEFDSPNYHEFSYSKKAKGNNKIQRILMIMLYVLFVGAFFLICYMTRIIPLFALAPLFLWMLVFFTWRLVSYDIYYEFKEGQLEIGKVKVTKRGRKKSPKLTIHVKDASYAAPYNESSEAIKEAKKIYDYSEAPDSENRIAIIFEKNGVKSALIFEGTAKMAKLLTSFCANSHNLKGQQFHG